MDRTLLTTKLALALATDNDGDLITLAVELGFSEPKKSAVNLRLLRGVLTEEALLAEILLAAAGSASPDQAINGLERLTATVPSSELFSVLEEESSRGRLLVILGASPFLTGILCRNQSYFRDLFPGGEIDRRKDEERMLAELRERIPDGTDLPALQKELRLYKCREILRIAGRDLCALADLAEVTGELSALAAAALQRSYEICDKLLRAEYGAPLLDAAGGIPCTEAEFTIFGMGKFGGRELNFSSDIDLIYFYSSEKGMTAGVPGPSGEPKNRIHLHQYFCKMGEMITRAVGQATEDGFVFRVDLRLRPEGNSGEMANSLRSAEVYYESWGQSWERAAMIKARPVAGSIPLGERLLKSLEPFVFRRYLDYGMVEDIKLMKQKIDRSLTREREGELNLKLGRGGIREIEFFIQALQLIHAGKHPALREKNSLAALEKLLRERLIGRTEHDLLRDAYVFLRTVEHRIQVVQERQTHNLPARADEMLALARRCGFPDAEGFGRALERHRQGVESIYRELFYTSEKELREEVRSEVAFLFDPTADSDLVKDLLEEKGFKNPDAAFDILLILRDGPPHSHLTARGRRLFERIAPLLMQEVIDSPEPDMALFNLEKFLMASRRARGTFYALLAENREIIKVLVSLFGTSQFLSRIFIQHPEILDSLVSRSYALSFKDRDNMQGDLEVLLQSAEGYEDKLDVLRRFRKEEFLRIAMGDIHGHMPQGQGTNQLSTLADVCLGKALEIAREELLPRFGIPFARDEKDEEHEAAFAILGMGKLGGMELNYHSDLDIIFIYEGEGETRPAPDADPDRFRGLSNSEYFSRLAQRIISVLTLMTREGYVYQIDTRLRPSGNQGPLVTSLPAFERYHRTSAQLWERQALAKARTAAGSPAFAGRIEELVRRLVYEQAPAENLRGEIYRLRGRMETEIAREGADHLNIKTGRGGMVDVEFLAQYLQLLHGKERPKLRQTNTLATLQALRDEGLLTEGDHGALAGGYKFLRRLENKLRLIHDQSINELSGERAYLVKLARRLDYPPPNPDKALLEDYLEVTGRIREIFERFLGPDWSG